MGVAFVLIDFFLNKEDRDGSSSNHITEGLILTISKSVCVYVYDCVSLCLCVCVFVHACICVLVCVCLCVYTCTYMCDIA